MVHQAHGSPHTLVRLESVGRAHERADPPAPHPVDPPQVACVIDCDRCTMRDQADGCADCMVTALLGGPPAGPPLDEAEQRAIRVLADAGLVPPLRMVHPLSTRTLESDTPQL